MSHLVDEHCRSRLREYSDLVSLRESFMLSVSVLSFVFSPVVILGNLLAIRALQKASSIPATSKKLFLCLAVSDIGVGLIVLPMAGCINAVMLNTAGNGSFEFLCPTTLMLYLFFAYILTAVSFLSVAAIAMDRLLALYLHLRYQAIVTPRRVFFFLRALWATSFLGAAIFIFLPSHSDIAIVSGQGPGLLVTTVAYFQINRVVRHHRIEIQSQQQVQNDQAITFARVRKSAFNTVYVYFVFLACYLPALCSAVVKTALDYHISLSVFYHFTYFLMFLNSSLNPCIYCWRYREIRNIMKSMLNKIFMNEPDT